MSFRHAAKRGVASRHSLLRKSGSLGVLGLLAAAVIAVASWPFLEALAGNNNFRGGAVGGVSIDTDGVLRSVTVDAKQSFRRIVLRDLKPTVEQLTAPVELRKVSLRGLEAAIADINPENFNQLPDEVKYLAGLQRIHYVVLSPDENDILLVGPAEGWKVDDGGNVVGITTGQPVLQLEDLAMAFRTINAARQGGISCSIDPTPEGHQNLRKFLSTHRQMGPNTLAGMQQALGPQTITVTGVPGDSHFARVLVAADYHMKRIAMNLDPSPVKGLVGFLDLVKAQNVRVTNLMPRWWLACNYEPLLRSEDGLVWELRGPGVKAMTEDEVVNADGTYAQTGKENPVARKWADMMTERYDQLSAKNAVFGDLRNVMDMCVIAALIQKEGLMQKAGCSLPRISDSGFQLAAMRWPVPKSVATQCSFIRRDREYIVTASGGVQIDSFAAADRVKVDDSIKAIRDRSQAGRSTTTFWWN
jgi:hypothetical protein